ncbi:MAG TPA: type II toxin-antitoxin system RelE/ParE family toxin [Candidatus Binatia bacterium]|nr:type II toxin-antitoxin system RelE/ParE family toxin [Candidatus Binatia bacterium]
MAGRSQLFFTENFTANLDEIQTFLSVDGRSAFQRLLNRLFDDICPQVTRFPLSGRSFLGHQAGSAEVEELIEQVRERLRRGDDLREFVVDDYIVLYLVRRRRIYFIAIKHHRQLSFDLRRFWS